MDVFGEEGNREEREIPCFSMIHIVGAHGPSRFENIKHTNKERISNRAGFYMTDNEGFRLFMVLTEVFKNELCKGFEPKTVVNVLLNAGWLKPSK